MARRKVEADLLRFQDQEHGVVNKKPRVQMETPAFSSVPSHTEPCTAVWLHAFSPDNIITRLHMFLLTLWLMSLAAPGHHQAPADIPS